MIFSEKRARPEGGREGPAPCPVCDAGLDDGDLCLTHRAMVDREPPEHLVKATPPKRREVGCVTPDWLWTVALVLFMAGMLARFGLLR